MQSKRRASAKQAQSTATPYRVKARAITKTIDELARPLNRSRDRNRLGFRPPELKLRILEEYVAPDRPVRTSRAPMGILPKPEADFGPPAGEDRSKPYENLIILSGPVDSP